MNLRPLITGPNLAVGGRCAIVAALALAAAIPLTAQHLPRSFATTPDPWAEPAPASTVAAFGHPADYRWEGLVIGGVGLGAFLAVGLTVFCHEMSDARGQCSGIWLGGLLVGGTAGAVTGGLIGGLIPKAAPDP